MITSNMQFIQSISIFICVILFVSVHLASSSAATATATATAAQNNNSSQPSHSKSSSLSSSTIKSASKNHRTSSSSSRNANAYTPRKPFNNSSSAVIFDPPHLRSQENGQTHTGNSATENSNQQAQTPPLATKFVSNTEDIPTTQTPAQTVTRSTSSSSTSASSQRFATKASRSYNFEKPPHTPVYTYTFERDWFLPENPEPLPTDPEQLLQIKRKEVFVQTAEELKQLLRYLERSARLGFDTEFVTFPKYRSSLEVLQVCTDEIMAAIDCQLLKDGNDHCMR